MVKFSDMSRGKFAAVAVMALVFVVGAITVVRGIGAVTGHLAKVVTGGSTLAGKVSIVQNANFAYWVPGSDPGWTYDPKSKAVDPAHGVITFAVNFTGSPQIKVKISQQQMPDTLKPVGGGSWKHFIDQEKPVTDQPVGDGTIYYLPSLVNGVQASDGSDTIIFASDDILMFGRASEVTKSAQWSKLIDSMTKTTN